MPRTIQEILDHADELAKKFEDSTRPMAIERPSPSYLLQRAALAHARASARFSKRSRPPTLDGVPWARSVPAGHIGQARSSATAPSEPV